MRVLLLFLTILSLTLSCPGSARGGSDTHGLRRDDVDDDDDDDDDDLNDASSVAAAARAPAMPSGL